MSSSMTTHSATTATRGGKNVHYMLFFTLASIVEYGSNVLQPPFMTATHGCIFSHIRASLPAIVCRFVCILNGVLNDIYPSQAQYNIVV
jgi:hypothetical protein